MRGLVGKLSLKLLVGGDVANLRRPILDGAIAGALNVDRDAERAGQTVDSAIDNLAVPVAAGWVGQNLARDLVAQGLQQASHCGFAHEIDCVVDSEEPASRGIRERW